MSDLEGRRLHAAIVDAAVAYLGHPTLSNGDELAIATRSLRDHLAKGSAPESMCQPPKKYAHLQHHWLTSERSSSPCMSEWLNGAWHSAGEAGDITPREMRRRGWEYDRPCVYESPQPPTRQAVSEWYRSRTVYDSPVDLIMKALVHFGVSK